MGQNSTLAQDIPAASEWIAEALTSSGYKADYSLESMEEIDRFFEEQGVPGGVIPTNLGSIIFALGAYIGQTAIKLYGGEWITDDKDPEGEVKIAVRLANDTMLWPVIKCMKRYQNGQEDSIYAYFCGIRYMEGH